MRKEFLSRSPEETELLGVKVGKKAFSGMVVACVGDLGAGKTTFIRGVARGLGSKLKVTSPTFVLLHIYDDGRLPLYHFDAYRLGSEAEFEALGAEEYLWGDGVSVVEWADKVRGTLPVEKLEVILGHKGDMERSLELRGEGERYRLWLEKLE